MKSLINLGEVLNIVERERVLDAAHVKANQVLSYADAFAVAAATQEKAIILTGDPKFKAVEALLSLEWIQE